MFSADRPREAAYKKTAWRSNILGHEAIMAVQHRGVKEVRSCGCSLVITVRIVFLASTLTYETTVCHKFADRLRRNPFVTANLLANLRFCAFFIGQEIQNRAFPLLQLYNLDFSSC